MEQEKTLLNQVASEGYSASDRPFDFVGEGGNDRPALRTRSGRPGCYRL